LLECPSPALLVATGSDDLTRRTIAAARALAPSLARWESERLGVIAALTDSETEESAVSAGTVPVGDPAANELSPFTLCLVDPWRGNLLFDGGRLTGVVDFAAIERDHPAVDLARSLGSLLPEHPERWPTAFLEYRRHTPLSDADIHLVDELHRLTVITAPLRWIERALAEPELAGRHSARRLECVIGLERLAREGSFAGGIIAGPLP
jgi:Ser/Thr protein kinase RdoA (MazF antagonist)